MPNELIQIVPRLPPAVDGVGEYALHLAEALGDKHGLISRFVVGDPTWPGVEVASNPAKAVSARSAKGLLRALAGGPGRVAMLHYVGYGYSQRGVPSWLVRGLREWVARGNRLTTFFHEIWASGPPWGSVFWLKPWQKHLTMTVARLSVVGWTSNLRMARMLGNRFSVVPISSPLANTIPIRKCQPGPPPWRILIFGLTGPRLRTVQKFLTLLEYLGDKGLLRQVTLLGNGASKEPNLSPDAALLEASKVRGSLRVMGQVDGSAVISAFCEADFFLSAHPAFLACKSTAIMTAFACGCPVVLPDGEDAAPLAPGQHFLACGNSEKDLAQFGHKGIVECLGALGRAGRAWYGANADWSHTARIIFETLSTANGRNSPGGART